MKKMKPKKYNILRVNNIKNIIYRSINSILSTKHDNNDLESILKKQTSNLSYQEQNMLLNVLKVKKYQVIDIMVPRSDIISVNLDSTFRELLLLFKTEGHSRLPVYRKTLDNPQGMLHIRDFLNFLANKITLTKPQKAANNNIFPEYNLDSPISSAKEIIRPLLFSPHSMPILSLLVRMQATRTHMSLVVDEYGGTDGLLSMEDIVETIVGDIEDEHDELAMPKIETTNKNTFIVDARTSLDNIIKTIKIDISKIDNHQEIDTIGGLVTNITGHVPINGEIIKGPSGYEFEILDADPRKIKRIKIIKRKETTNK